ncbi:MULTISPECIES: tail protein X [Asaia]|uniref:tail protein X n=1 Tax=Asaia TaxID=91914 RepID=UPI002FC33291
MQTYKTQAGDVLDGVIYQAFGYCNDDALAQVYALNQNLADYGPVFPVGVSIILPDNIQATAPNTGTISLWD